MAAPFADLIGLAPLALLDHPITRGLGMALSGLGILAAFATVHGRVGKAPVRQLLCQRSGVTDYRLILLRLLCDRTPC